MRISDWSSDVCSSDLGFYTKTGVGTLIAEGKEVKNFDGQDYILERGIFADLAIIKGWKADESGNLIFRKTARNFNQPMATAAKICVAEVEEIVPVGSLDPDGKIGRASGRDSVCKGDEHVVGGD